MSAKRSAKAPVAVFEALADETRLALIGRLREGTSCSIAALTEGTGMTRQGVAKHLRVLSAAGLVVSRRVGREHRFELTVQKIQQARDYLDQVSSQWEETLARLQRSVED